jgi:hypothetical protein
VHVIAPLAELQKDPLPNAVASLTLREYASKGVTLPEGAARFCIIVDGTETEAEVEALKVWRPKTWILLKLAWISSSVGSQ